jgi:hypothetical protein
VPERIRGFGHVKEAHLKDAKAEQWRAGGREADRGRGV